MRPPWEQLAPKWVRRLRKASRNFHIQVMILILQQRLDLKRASAELSRGQSDIAFIVLTPVTQEGRDGIRIERIAFNVPEPSALLLLALGAIGVARRLGRRVACSG